MRYLLPIGITVLLALPATAGEVPEKYRSTVEKGLAWLAKQQAADGHWSGSGDQYPVALTSMAGLAFLAEGSTSSQGTYAKQIHKAASWLMEHRETSGLIVASNSAERSRYIFGHGYALLFLACLYDKTEDKELRRRLGSALNRAVRFAAKAQTKNGGFGYVSAADGNDFSEGAATVVMIQGLRAARNAGIPVPKQVFDKALDYLEKSTEPRGGIVYSLNSGVRAGTGRPALTAGAISAAYGPEDYHLPLVKRWIEYCHARMPIGGRIFSHAEFTHFYYAQCIYALGDDGYAVHFPRSRPGDQLTWSAYRAATFEDLKRKQAPDGSYTGYIGPVYSTSLYMTVLQLDKDALPFFASGDGKQP